jgi:hypothetical protein
VLVGSTSVPIGIGIAHVIHAQLWYNSETDSANECSDDYTGPWLPGCPTDFMKHVVGLPLLVGTWNIMNVTTTGGADKNLIGVMTFSKDGSMKFVLPMTVVYDSSGDKSNTVNGSWGVNGN